MASNIGRAQPAGAWDGPYRPLPGHNDVNNQYHHCCEAAHAILLAKPGPTQGKVLIIDGAGQRWLWDPASPNSVSIDPTDTENVFCSGHSADGEGNIILHGGTRSIPYPPTPPPCTSPPPPPYCGPQPTWSYVLDPAGTVGMDYAYHSMLVPTFPPPNLGYYYPGSLRLPNGWVLSAGGGSSPLYINGNGFLNVCCDSGSDYFVNGWQYFKPSVGGWVGQTAPTNYFPGLPSPYEFHFYPLLTVMPGSMAGTGFVFAAMATNYRSGNYETTTPFTPVGAPTAGMDLGPALGNGLWVPHQSQIRKTYPGGTPRNLEYPNGFQWPIHLGATGQLTSVRRFVVLGGADRNDYLSDTAANATPVHPLGGRPAVADVNTIDDPDPAGTMGTWTNGVLPPLLCERIFCNTVLTPDEQAFVVGGSFYDFLPYTGQTYPPSHPQYLLLRYLNERIASPVFLPEMLDLTNSFAAWFVCKEHVSPRLYHSFALLLPDGRILVGGGYRGKKPDPGFPVTAPEHHTWYDWRNEHSDFEVYSPPYLFAGPRPQIVSITGGNTIGYYSATSPTFEITVALPGVVGPSNAAIGSVCLISPGSVTHHYGWDQRYIGTKPRFLARPRSSWLPRRPMGTSRHMAGTCCSSTPIPR